MIIGILLVGCQGQTTDLVTTTTNTTAHYTTTSSANTTSLNTTTATNNQTTTTELHHNDPGVIYSYYPLTDTYHVTGYEGTDSLVEILSTIDGKEVDVIEADAFSFNSVLTSIVIPETITKIEANAFMSCYDLESISVLCQVTAKVGSFLYSVIL